MIRTDLKLAARVLAFCLAASLPAACGGSPGALPGARNFSSSVLHAGGSTPIQHIIIIIQENRTFDNMFHEFPGANTVNTGKGHGKTYTLQPLPLKQSYDLNHSHTQFLEDYDQGQGDGFDDEIIGFNMNPGSGCSDYINHPTCWKFSNNAKIKQEIFSYVQQSDVQPYWTMATQYALGDNAFASNNGPTFVAHQYLIAGQSGHSVEVPNAQPWGCSGPASETVNLLAFGQANPPVFSKATGYEVPGPYPCFTYPTIANLLDPAGVKWSYYVEGKQPGANLSAFMAIQQIFKGPDWKNVKSPDTQIFNDISNNQLPNVSWVMPAGSNSDHPGPQSGDKGPCWVASIVNAVGQSPYWNSSAIIVMWDDWGGWYDHVHPPQYPDPQTGAREGLGFRVPLIVVSPYAKAGYISHTQHEIASTLNYIEETFGLGTIGAGSSKSYADQRVIDKQEKLDDIFDYTQKPITFQPIPAKCDARYFLTHPDHTPADTY